jgi:hypothetical protein
MVADPGGDVFQSTAGFQKQWFVEEIHWQPVP